MKISHIITATLLICLVGISFAIAQNDTKKGKSKSEKTTAKAIEVKANLLISNPDGTFSDSIKPEEVKIYENGVEQKITYFARRQNILNVGLVVDNTGSMRILLDEIVKAGSIIAANIKPTDEAFVVRFVDRTKISVEQEWTSNRAELIAALENLYIEGGQSAITDALVLSAEKIFQRAKSDNTKRYALILISDGEERDSFYKFDELIKFLDKTDIQIFMLSYANSAPKNPKEALKFSNKLAFETGGIVRVLSKKRTSEEITDSLKAIVGELNSNYIIEYTSTNQKRDGLVRKLTVQIADGAKGEKRQPTLREGFVVPEEK